MKKILMFLAAVATAAAAVSCEETNSGYEGTNYIYLDSENNSLYDFDGANMQVTAMLTTALDEDLTLTLKMDNDTYVSLESDNITIPAGSLTTVFNIVVKDQLPEGTSSVNCTVSLDPATVLPEKVRLAADYTFTLHSSATPDLTEEQLAIISAYQEATGIDLTKYLGLVSVSTVYTASNPDSEIPLSPVTYSGQTMIVLSEKSTAGQPVLEMLNNPMGLQGALYAKLRSLTLDNPSWASEYAMSYSQLLEAIGWTSTSSETFSMTLDGIKPQTNKSVEFLADLSYYDEEYEEDVTMIKVPFEFYFSAFEREKAQIAAGVIGSEANPDWLYDATVDPDFYLNSDNIAEDYYESGNWVESSASIAGDKMVFTFCLYNYTDYDYSKVVATYTPNE